MFPSTGTGSLVVGLKELRRVLVHGRDAVAQLNINSRMDRQKTDRSWTKKKKTQQVNDRTDVTVSKQTKMETGTARALSLSTPIVRPHLTMP